MGVKNQLLDPLSTLCRLVELNFSGKYSKISIQDHILSIDKYDILQPLKRSIRGDDKENISILYHVVIRLIKWFLLATDSKNNNKTDDDSGLNMNTDIFSDSKEFVDEVSQDSADSTSIKNTINNIEIGKSKEFKKMLIRLCQGLKCLQETYNDGNVIFNIQYYIVMIENALNNDFSEDRLPKHLRDREKEFENLLDYGKIKNLWNLDKIRRISELYDNCFSVKDDINTPETEKRRIIKGYLTSIDAILQITERQFQELCINSIKG